MPPIKPSVQLPTSLRPGEDVKARKGPRKHGPDDDSQDILSGSLQAGGAWAVTRKKSELDPASDAQLSKVCVYRQLRM